MKTMNAWKLALDVNSVTSHVLDLRGFGSDPSKTTDMGSVQSILEQSPVTALVQTPFGAQELDVVKLGVEQDKGFVVILTSPVKLPTPVIGLGFIAAIICALAGLIVGVSL